MNQPVFLLSVFSEGLANTNFILTLSEIKLTTAKRANYTTDVVKKMYIKLKKKSNHRILTGPFYPPS
jgi:hypothetical protein